MYCPICGANNSLSKVLNSKKSYDCFDIRIHTCFAEKKKHTFLTIEIPEPVDIKTAHLVIKSHFADKEYYEVYNPYRLAKSLTKILGFSNEEAMLPVVKLNNIIRKAPASYRCLEKDVLIILTTQMLFRLPYEGVEYRKAARHIRNDYKLNPKNIDAIVNNTAFQYFKYYYDKLDFQLPELLPEKKFSLIETYIHIINRETSFYTYWYVEKPTLRKKAD